MQNTYLTSTKWKFAAAIRDSSIAPVAVAAVALLFLGIACTDAKFGSSGRAIHELGLFVDDLPLLRAAKGISSAYSGGAVLVAVACWSRAG